MSERDATTPDDRPALAYASPRTPARSIDRRAWLVATIGGTVAGIALSQFDYGIACLAPVAGAVVAWAAAIAARWRRVRFGLLADACLLVALFASWQFRGLLHFGSPIHLGLNLGVIAAFVGLPGLIVAVAVGIARVDPSEFEPGPHAR